MTKAALTSCRMALIPLGFAAFRRVIRNRDTSAGSGWAKENFWNFLGS